jgi:hypothetical protein
LPSRQLAFGLRLAAIQALMGSSSTRPSSFPYRPTADSGSAGRWQSTTNKHEENLWFSDGQVFQVAFETIVVAAEQHIPILAIDAPYLLGNFGNHLLQKTRHLIARAARAAALFGLVVGTELGFAAQMGALRDHRGYNILFHLAHLD